MKVKHYDDAFHVKIESWEGPRIKQAPKAEKTDTKGIWILSETLQNAMWLEKEATATELSPGAKAKIIMIKNIKTANVPFPTWYNFKTTPMDHQRKALNRAWGKDEFGLFMEMGTGKTWVNIQLACANRMEGNIDGLLVICPTAIKPVWEIELELHAPIPIDTYVLNSGKYKQMHQWIAKKHDFPVLIVGIEALSQGKAKKEIEAFMKSGKMMVSIDESSKIKNFKSVRTEECWDLGTMGVIRTIMTGTPITQGIHDVFAQFYFMSPDIIGQTSFYPFRNRYCILGGFKGKAITGYQNIGELMELISPHVYIVTKKEALDLPDKVYMPARIVTPSKDQLKAIKELRDTHETVIDGQEIECKTMLERMTRYQQICGGFYPRQEDPNDENSPWTTERIPGKNPKIEELKEVLNEIPNDAKVIIWARFVDEIEAIIEALESLEEGRTLSYYGATENRREAIDLFQKDPQYRYMVSNQQIGGMGVTWTAATFVIYFSNTFSYEDRIQSEDRAHRKGQTNKVTYIDLILDIKEDKMIKTALGKKQSMATYVSENMQAVQATLE